jgi:hypothetical protein
MRRTYVMAKHQVARKPERTGGWQREQSPTSEAKPHDQAGKLLSKLWATIYEWSETLSPMDGVVTLALFFI